MGTRRFAVPRDFMICGHEYHRLCKPCSAIVHHLEPKVLARSSETATTATTLPSGRVGRCGGNVLDASNTHTGTSEGAEGRLSAGAGGLGAVTTCGPNLDVEGRDAELLAAGGYSWVSTVACAPVLRDGTHRRPGLPTWLRTARTRHGRP